MRDDNDSVYKFIHNIQYIQYNLRRYTGSQAVSFSFDNRMNGNTY